MNIQALEFDSSVGNRKRHTAKQTGVYQDYADLPPRVAVVILNLDGKSHIQRLLQSLSRAHSGFFELEVIVVDNGSTDDSVPVIRQELKHFARSHLIVNDENLGAAEGRNQALKYLLDPGRTSKLSYGLMLDNDVGSEECGAPVLKYALQSNTSTRPDYILTLDNDTIVDPQVIAELVHRAEASSPEELVFAPLLYFSEDPERRWTSWWTNGWRLPGQMEADWGARDQYNNGRTVDGVATAAALFKSSAFLEFGYFDDRLFFSHEDYEWFQRVRLKGYEIKLVPVKGKVLHDCHQSLGGAKEGIFSPLRIYYYLRNSLLMMTLFSYPGRLRPLQFLKLARYICLFSLRTIGSMDWQGFKAIWAGLYDGLRRRTGAGRGALFQRQKPLNQ